MNRHKLNLMGHLVPIFVIAAVSFTAEASKVCHAALSRSLPDHFVELVHRGQMLNQQAPQLDHLKVAGGGLCVTTAGAAVLSAIGQKHDRSLTELAPFHVERQIELAREKWPLLDARYGALIDRLEILIPEIASVYNIEVIAKSKYGVSATFENLIHLPQDSLTAVSVQISQEKEHALVLLNYDPQSQSISYWDPNYESQILTAPIRKSQDGRAILHINSYGVQSMPITIWTNFQ